MGPIAAIAAAEKAKGHMVRHPGDEPWFPLSDWDNSLISMEGRRVRIVMVRARIPGHGAFARMVYGILHAGLTPVVICPLEPMRLIVQLWHWHKHFSCGNFFEREETWVPTKKWKEERLKCQQQQ